MVKTYSKALAVGSMLSKVEPLLFGCAHMSLNLSMCTLSLKRLSCDSKRTKLYSDLIAVYYYFFQFYPLHKSPVSPKGIQEKQSEMFFGW